jgi:hypothetical protein
MKTIKHIMLVALVLVAAAASAQKIKATKGDFSALKGQSKVNVEFVYDNVMVGKDKEKDYIDRKVKEYNEKEAGKGDKWKAAWNNDRKSRYEPHFFEQFNKQSGLNAGSFPDAKYTLVVKVKRIEPGFNIVVMRKFAEIDTEISLVETSNKGKVLGTVTADRAPGRTYGYDDYDTGVRISEAFEMLGKSFGKYLAKANK